MFEVGDQVHIRGGWHSPTLTHTLDEVNNRSVEVGTVVWADKGTKTNPRYTVKFWSNPNESYLCEEESLVRADVQAG